MMPPIHPLIYLSPHFPIRQIHNLQKRIWKIVDQIFKFMKSLPELCYDLYFRLSNKAVYSKEIQDKLKPYKRLSSDDSDFLKDSVKILREHLKKKDLELAANLEKLGVNLATDAVPAELNPKQLETFDHDFESCSGSCFERILMAAIRAFIFSQTYFFNSRFAYFMHKELVEVRPRCWRYVVVDYRPLMKKVRTSFDELPSFQQAIILDEFEPTDIKALTLSDRGKEILNNISKMANSLSQNNPLFCEACQTIMTGD